MNLKIRYIIGRLLNVQLELRNLCLPPSPTHHGPSRKDPSRIWLSSSVASRRDQRCSERWGLPLSFAGTQSLSDALASRADIRNIIADDEALQEGVAPALQEYNVKQFTTVNVPETNHQVRRSRWRPVGGTR